MPTPENIRLQASVNGGAPQTGAITVAFGDVVVFSVANPSGVNRALYRLDDFPEEFACPSGWTTDADGTYYVITQGGAAPAVTMPEDTLWGKFFPSVEANERKRNSAIAQDLYDNSTALKIPSVTGVEDIGYLEDRQFDPRRKWVGQIKRTLRIIDQLVLDAGVTGTGTAGNFARWVDETTLEDVSPTIGLILSHGNDADGDQIKNLLDPTDDQDAVTKAYLEDVISSSGFHTGLGTIGQLAYFSNTYEVVADPDAAGFSRSTNGTLGIGWTVGGSGVTGSDFAHLTARGNQSKFVLADAAGTDKAVFLLIGGNAYLSTLDATCGLNVAAYDPKDVTTPLGPEVHGPTDVSNSSSLVVSETLTSGYIYRGHYTVTARKSDGTVKVCDRVVRCSVLSSTVNIIDSYAVGTDSSGIALTFSVDGLDIDATAANTSGGTCKIQMSYSFIREALPAVPT